MLCFQHVFDSMLCVHCNRSDVNRIIFSTDITRVMHAWIRRCQSFEVLHGPVHLFNCLCNSLTSHLLFSKYTGICYQGLESTYSWSINNFKISLLCMHVQIQVLFFQSIKNKARRWFASSNLERLGNIMTLQVLSVFNLYFGGGSYSWSFCPWLISLDALYSPFHAS